MYFKNFPQKKGYELGIFNKYYFHNYLLLNEKEMIIMVIADTTTTHWHGKIEATSKPTPKHSGEDTCFR